VKHSTMPCNAA